MYAFIYINVETGTRNPVAAPPAYEPRIECVTATRIYSEASCVIAAARAIEKLSGFVKATVTSSEAAAGVVADVVAAGNTAACVSAAGESGGPQSGRQPSDREVTC